MEMSPGGMRSNKRERRSSHGMSACVCGLDVHKESTYATILTLEGKIVDQMKMSNEKVLSYLSRFNVCKVAMESSNQVAALYRKLENKRIHCDCFTSQKDTLYCRGED